MTRIFKQLLCSSSGKVRRARGQEKGDRNWTEEEGGGGEERGREQIRALRNSQEERDVGKG